MEANSITIGDTKTKLVDKLGESRYQQENLHEFSLYILDIVDLGVKISEGQISRKKAVIEYERIRKLSSYKILPMDPFLLARREYLQRIQDNIQFLYKHGNSSPGLFYAAIDEWTRIEQPPLTSKLLPVLKYFQKFPLSTFSRAAKALNQHLQTTSQRFRKLKEDYWFIVKGLVNNWKFGLRLFILFFNLESKYSWDSFFQSISEYPFLNIANEDRFNGHHYLTFQLPNDKSVVHEFKRSISDLAGERFTYWRLQEGIAGGFSKNMGLLNEDGWAYPEELVHSDTPPTIASEFQPMIKKCDSEPLYDYCDFLVSDVLSSDCRLPASAISTRTGLRPSAVYRKKQKLLSRGVVQPLTLWTHVDFGHLRIECDCSQDMTNSLLAIALKLPMVAYYITTQGIVLWMDVPTDHISRYIKYFRGMFDSDGVSSHRMVIGKTWTGGRPRADIARDWKIGPRGFTIEGIDISPDIADYIKV